MGKLSFKVIERFPLSTLRCFDKISLKYSGRFFQYTVCYFINAHACRVSLVTILTKLDNFLGGWLNNSGKYSCQVRKSRFYFYIHRNGVSTLKINSTKF